MRLDAKSKLALLTLLVLQPFATQAAESGFLSDYSKLAAPVAGMDGGSDRVYAPEEFTERLTKFDTVMVDEPEVFIGDTSPYQGAKPDELKAISASVREELLGELQKAGYKIGQSPGPTVLYIRPAVTNLLLQKKSRSVLAYTPIGFVVNAGVKSLQDLMQKYDIVGMDVEAEVIDSTTKSVLAAAVLSRGAMKNKAEGTKAVKLSFEDLQALLDRYTGRFACRMSNAKLAADKRINCMDPKAVAAAKPKT